MALDWLSLSLDIITDPEKRNQTSFTQTRKDIEKFETSLNFEGFT